LQPPCRVVAFNKIRDFAGMRILADVSRPFTIRLWKTPILGIPATRK